jgi:hypothetical protein
MTRDDIQKLLGGYATGTLTPEEQRVLFEAALTDQELFDALAREQALRDVLSDPAARAHLLAAMDDAPAPWYRAWWRPMVVMAAAVLVVVGVAVWEHSREPKPRMLAKVELPRFTPPVETQSPAPALPPPPEVKTAPPAIKPLPLPAAAPIAPPRPTFAMPAAAPPPLPPPQDRALYTAPLPQGFLPAQQSPQVQQSQQSQQSQQQFQIRARQAAVAGNILPQIPVAVHGTVTDASGVGVPSATVALKSLTTGETVNTSTNERGEFSASEMPGSTYEISASKLGFRTASAKDIAPLNGAPAPVNLTLQVGAATETVEVTAANSIVPTTQAVSTRASLDSAEVVSMSKAKKAPALPQIAYQLLRAVPGSEPAEVPVEGMVPAGSVLTLRITPAADGYLRIVEGDRTIATPRVRRGVASNTLLPQFNQPGRVELQLYFSHSKTESKQQPPAVTIAFTVQ